MDLRIAHNPHLKSDDQKELWQMLQEQVSINTDEEEYDSGSAIAILKEAMSQSQGFQLK